MGEGRPHIPSPLLLSAHRTSWACIKAHHLYALGAAASGKAVLGDGGTIITQDFDRYPIVRMQSVPVDAHGKVS